MIYKNANVGNLNGVTVAEFGNGTISVSLGNAEIGKCLFLKSQEQQEIGTLTKCTAKTTDELEPEVVLIFKNKKGLDALISSLEDVRKEFLKGMN